MSSLRNVVGALLAAAVAAALFFPVGGGVAAKSGSVERVESIMDLSEFSDAEPEKRLSLLFIHHSCGGQMLGDPGPEDGPNNGRQQIWKSHPNGGGGRRRLEEAGYAVHEASYGSAIGEKTDFFDWPSKFRDRMDVVLGTKLQDERLPAGEQNRIVLFKSCFTNNDFVGEGTEPGNPAGPELTLANAKAALIATLKELEKNPGTLFVYVTSPPSAPKVAKEPAWKWALKKVLGKPEARQRLAEQARIARMFNNWIIGKDGWLARYPGRNVVVFDNFDILTDGGTSNLDCYASEDGWDPHPSATGNAKVAEALVPFLNRAVRRAGL